MVEDEGRRQEGGAPVAGGRRLWPGGAWLGLGLYLALALATTYPLWLHLNEAVPGDIGDPLLNTWILAWDAHALLARPLQLFDANLFYPLPNTLAYSEHLVSTALLAMPLNLASGEPVVAYNLSLLLSFPLAGLGMYLLVLHWTHRRGAASLAGLAFALAPYRLAAITHLQLLTIQWLPFSLLALDRLLEQPAGETGRQIGGNRRWSFVARLLSFVIFTTWQVLASWYLAVFSGLVLGLYSLTWLVMRSGRGTPKLKLRRLAGLLLGLLAVAGITLPFARPYLDVLPQLQAARPPGLAASFGAQAGDFLAAAPHLRAMGPWTEGLARRAGFTEENTLFLGLVTPLLALLGLAAVLPVAKARTRWHMLALVSILVISLALTFAGPYRLLTQWLPALTVVRVPPRWIIPATLALAGLAGYGAAWLCEAGRGAKDGGRAPTAHRPAQAAARLLPMVACVVAGLLVAESFSAPLPLAVVGARADLPPVYRALQQEALAQPGDWGIIELPMYVAPAPEFPETKRLYASSLGWWGLVNGYSGFTPERQMALDRALKDFPSQEALQTLRRLGESGVRYVVVHPGEAGLDRAQWEAAGRWQAERGTSLLPLGSFGPDDLYVINPYGDDLIADPARVSDGYWSARTPARLDVRFRVPDSPAEIRLLAYRTLEDSVQPAGFPGQTRLTLYWQTSAALDTSYTVFVHSLSAEGGLIGQADGPPLANHYPTTAWQAGEIVADSRLVPAGGRYRVGLYDPRSGERLPAFGAEGARLADDALVLEPGQ
jgi:hypothetical protein